MFIMGVDQQGSWDSSPWALAEILNPCMWRVPEHGGQGGGEQSAFSPSCSQGFLCILRVNAICTEEEEEEKEEESIHHVTNDT